VLLPGQEQARHDHPDQDKFYLVHEGTGRFELGEERFDGGPGDVIWAPAGVPHGVRNETGERLVVLVGMGPPPAPKA
jgi:quercetin dioxygenase-like cupin family protein